MLLQIQQSVHQGFPEQELRSLCLISHNGVSLYKSPGSFLGVLEALTMYKLLKLGRVSQNIQKEHFWFAGNVLLSNFTYPHLASSGLAMVNANPEVC